MTKAYYYTDALAAAWMAKHFGMAFDVNDFDGVMFRNWSDWERFFTSNFNHFQKGSAKWRVSEDSLHLLEPRDGDEGTDSLGFQCEHDEYGWLRCSEESPHPLEPVTIDKRDGIAFHWPESEEV